MPRTESKSKPLVLDFVLPDGVSIRVEVSHGIRYRKSIGLFVDDKLTHSVLVKVWQRLRQRICEQISVAV